MAPRHLEIILIALLSTASLQAGTWNGSVIAPKAVPTKHLHHVFQVSSNLLSGNAPTGDAAFAELDHLGVKTVVSVDGSQPDVESAHKHGIRYIHLPIGYNGVPPQRVAELAKAAQTAEGPIYVHCHHGLHRGPAAVAVMCEATAGWSTNQAIAWLKQAGTSPDYAGLYRSAHQFQPPTPQDLSAITELPERAKASSLVESMVSIDEELERLKAAQKTAWAAIPQQPDLTPGQSATLLWEHLRELQRSQDTAHRPADYRVKLENSTAAVETLRQALANKGSSASARDESLRSVIQSCTECHKVFRN